MVFPELLEKNDGASGKQGRLSQTELEPAATLGVVQLRRTPVC